MTNDWNKIAESYEQSQIRKDSFDSLVDYPAQRAAMGDIENKRILDIACGSGRKAFEWAVNGAKEVFAFDIADPLVEAWKTKGKPDNLKIFKGDIAKLPDMPELYGKKFDLITSFQAVGYPSDLTVTFRAIRNLLEDDGRFILSTAHPFRYVVEKMETMSLEPAVAYRQEGPYSYNSTWNSSETSTDYLRTISARINAILDSGFNLERVIEPCLTKKQEQEHPHKKAWADKYFGNIICVARAK